MWVNVDSSCRDIELEVKLEVVGDSTGEVVTGVVVVAALGVAGRAGRLVVRLWLDWRLLSTGMLIDLNHSDDFTDE